MKQSILYLLCWVTTAFAFGQTTTMQGTPPPDVISEAKKEEIKKEIQVKDQKWALRLRNRPERTEPEDTFQPSQSATELLKMLLYVIVILLIMTILLGLGHLLTKRVATTENVTETPSPEVDIQDITAIDPQQMIDKALQNGDYRGAIRGLFLRNLQLMDQHHLIDWKPYKTNRDYLNELINADNYNSLIHMVNTYERIWYGNIDIDAATYERVAGGFHTSIFLTTSTYEQ